MERLRRKVVSVLLVLVCVTAFGCAGAPAEPNDGAPSEASDVPLSSDVASPPGDGVEKSPVVGEEASTSGAIPSAALISPSEVSDMVERGDNVLLMDTRKSTDWVDFRIYRAKSYPINQLEQRVNFIKAFKTVVIAAQDGAQAQAAWDILAAHDLRDTKVLVMDGGYEAYLAEGLPIKDTPPTRECY